MLVSYVASTVMLVTCSKHSALHTSLSFLLLQADEFVVYSPHQQCLRYLVEFTLPGDEEPSATDEVQVETGIPQAAALPVDEEGDSPADEGQ